MILSRFRNYAISLFVVLWLLVFHYESLRHFYLDRWLDRELPKVKFLFPPAGWIMFYNVDERYGHVEVFGIKDGKPQLIDPHLILATRTIGFDNIHRNVLSSVLYEKKKFSEFLKRKFPYFESFLVTYVQYPSVIKEPHRRLQQIIYTVSREKIT